MRAPKLAGLELARFGRGRLPRAAMAAIVLLPLLYGALYLWSFWDPYDRLDRIPVALVNEDKGAQAGGKHISAGDSISEGLRDSRAFDWRETDAADAREGVEDGRYYLSLTVPADFSERIASSGGDDPRAGSLKVRTNDASNYIVGQISRTVFSEVRAAASRKASRSFFDKMFVSFSTLHDRTAQAADGADKIDDGIGKAKKGAGRLEAGLGKASDGSGRLKDGTSRLHTGAGTLENGSERLADGTQKLADKAHQVQDGFGPFLDEHGDEIGTAARAVARGSKALRDGLDTLPDTAHKAAADAREAADALDSLHTSRCTGGGSLLGGELDASCPQLKKAAKAADRAADVAERVEDAARKPGGIEKLRKDLDELNRTANLLADRAPHLGSDLDGAVAKIDKLNKGAHQVHSGASRLTGGLADAKSGVTDLDAGLGRLDAGAGTLHGGMYKLADGSERLAGGLHDGERKIPDYGEQERDDRTRVMADPVGLSSSGAHSAPNYGTGFAPYFIPLALWVGAMIAYMLLQPLNRRALAAGAPALRIAFSGWLPAAAVGVLQAGALLSVLHFGLGLRFAHGAAAVGFVLLVTLCFTAIVQFLGARFGPAGRVLVLAMLMLQLTSAGGTYPIETSPGFFNAVHPFLPMSYVVEGLRHLITGGGAEPVWRACAVLLAFTAGALALTAVTARRKQVWTVDKLHPEIAL
jgi:putative membrane protein